MADRRFIEQINRDFHSVFDGIEEDIERIHKLRIEGRYEDAMILKASCEERNELCKEILEGAE